MSKNGIKDAGIAQTLSNLLEAITMIILIPLVLIIRMIVLVIVLVFLASPLILLGWIIWVIAS